MSTDVAPRRGVKPGEWIDFAARRALLRRLSALTEADMRIHDRWGYTGSAGAGLEVHVRHPHLYRRILLGGSTAAGQAYVDGDWDTDDLTGVCREFLGHDDAVPGLERLLEPVIRFQHWIRRNTRAGSRRNIHAHYDLGNEFFSLFLDPTMAYSSGVFESPNDSLEQASINKFERLCRLLELGPADELLEIGCGWGGFAIHAAREYGCKVTAITISEAQFHAARERVCSAGLSDRIDIRLEDYRDVKGRFDKIASIEMIEAVGHQFLDGFFRRCAELLKENGMFALQAITVGDQHYDRYRRGTDFIREQIFPGGCLLSVHAMIDSVRRVTDFALLHQRELGHHYARTLGNWHDRFCANLESVRAQGFDDRFIRLWRFYLSMCEAGFEERRIGLSHLVFGRPGYRASAMMPVQET